MHNGKNIAEPKMVDGTHYKSAGRVLPFSGPLGEPPSDHQLGNALQKLIYGAFSNCGHGHGVSEVRRKNWSVPKEQERVITNEMQKQAEMREVIVSNSPIRACTFRQRQFYSALSGIAMRELIGIDRRKMSALIEDAISSK
jgi:hypothetical protein